jgi:hypothetical protein
MRQGRGVDAFLLCEKGRKKSNPEGMSDRRSVSRLRVMLLSVASAGTMPAHG